MTNGDQPLMVVWRLSLIYMLAGLSACGGPHGRNVFGRPEDDHLINHCTIGSGMDIALYVNTGGGAAVGTSFSVTAERKPDLAERQILYSEKPALTALRLIQRVTRDLPSVSASIGTPLPWVVSDNDLMRLADPCSENSNQ